MEKVTIVLPNNQTVVYCIQANKKIGDLRTQIKIIKDNIDIKKAQSLLVTKSEDHQKTQKDIQLYEEHLYNLKNGLVREEGKMNEMILENLFKCFDLISNELYN